MQYKTCFTIVLTVSTPFVVILWELDFNQSITFLLRFVYLFGMVHVYYGTYLEEVSSLPLRHVGPRDWIQAVGLGSRDLSPPSHRSGLTLTSFTMRVCGPDVKFGSLWKRCIKWVIYLRCGCSEWNQRTCSVFSPDLVVLFCWEIMLSRLYPGVKWHFQTRGGFQFFI